MQTGGPLSEDIGPYFCPSPQAIDVEISCSSSAPIWRNSHAEFSSLTGLAVGRIKTSDTINGSSLTVSSLIT